ncbi:MAG: glutamine--tRNA ligase/YqeY domain fusion protein [Pseudomonadales bacterium]
MASTSSHFINTIIDQDLKSGKHTQLLTRFPPEPNGYIHVGHAKSICLNFGIAEQYGEQVTARCNLRFDDTNPEKEDIDYVDSIKADIEWLGFAWDGDVRYASSYFDQLYDFALQLIESGSAYVDSLSGEEAREYRGTLTEPGRNSPHRERSIEENRDLFQRMRAGEFAEGAHVLRAKIDMAAPNMNMRDPIIYRIRFAKHHQTGDKWCIYPMYDFTHCLSDALEGVTHSLCTLEFEDHRPLYNWFIDQLITGVKPQQYEFARLNLNYTITSKRKLRRLVDEGLVDGWDDPRLPTIAAMRRRGYTPASIRNFCEAAGIARSNSVVDMAMLEYEIRNDLDKSASRAMCVLDPVKLVLSNFDADHVHTLDLPNHPKDESLGRREVPLTRELFIDRADFAMDPPGKWKRLAPEHPVRLRGAYVVNFEKTVEDEKGKLIEIHCKYDPDTLGKNPEGYKAKGVIHWVSAPESVEAEVRLYDRLFEVENPESGSDDSNSDFTDLVNPNSLAVCTKARAERSLAGAEPESRFQFEREGYFCVDRYDSTPERMVFNRVVGLRDSWAKSQKGV